MSYPTRLTELLNIDLPIMSAGMAGIAGPDLAAAVSNAGGIGTLGGIGMDPSTLRQCIRDTKARLHPGRPFGVDLLLPKLGQGARATNKDYTKGQLEALVDVMLDEKIDLFVCAVGVPPQWVVDALHAKGIVVMNMVGAPKHVRYCKEVGVDIICAQGSEAGGHTGDISTMVLLPQVVEQCHGTDIIVVGAGGIYTGAGIAACLALGAEGVWLGSRFIVTEEANVQKSYQKAILDARSSDTIRTEVYTGRPARALKNAYNTDWEHNRQSEKHDLLKRGIIPWFHDIKTGKVPPDAPSPIPQGYRDARNDETLLPQLSILPVGQACGGLTKIQSAQAVINDLMHEFTRAIGRFK